MDEQRLDRLEHRLDELNVSQLKILASIDYHIFRTDLSEERLEHMEEIWERLQAHLNRVEGMMIVGKWIIGLIGFIGTLIGIWIAFR